jgi:DNA-binding CsgD family transcriptional regulator
MDLSKRQAEIVERVARGQSDKAIAHELGISVRTVQTHIDLLAEKIPGPTPRRHRLTLFFFGVEEQAS